MSYALVVDGTIRSIGDLPQTARRLDSGAWLCPVNGAWDASSLAACGYVAVTTTQRPADTATDTYDYSVTLVAGVPTETWTSRSKTAEEGSRDVTATNGAALRDKARAAITANNTFLALAAPTNAQTLAQVKTLTKENTALIKLVLNELGDITGT